MHTRWIVVLLAALAVSLGAPAALAAPPTEVVEPVSWTISPHCGDVPHGVKVTGHGTLRTRTQFSTNAKGVSRLVIRQDASGTAADNHGGSYTWSYRNEFNASFTGFPYDGSDTDRFDVKGNGAAGGLHSSFVAKITVTGPGPTDFTIEFLEVEGDPFNCDPL